MHNTEKRALRGLLFLYQLPIMGYNIRKIRKPMKAILFLISLLLSITALASPIYTGKVVGITDGDTLTLLTAEKRQIKVRLAEIDTPEKRQPYGQRARQALSDLAFGKQARVEVQAIDRYGRTVGKVYVGNVDVNREMVRQGAAWVYRQYNKDKSLLTVEAEAKAAKRGLWALPEAEQTPPWEWRKQSRQQTQAHQVSPIKTATHPSHCGPKRYCKEMTSCDEAKRYLACGVTTIDGDRDGIPCEALCR
jgi:endonuclease YncB( thermonuclease family)